MSETAARRRTNPERTAKTQAALLDATIESLVDLGWSGTSTTEVVRRAGVSRGAQVHHFRTKDDLVLAAIERLLSRRQAEFDDAFDRLPPERRTPPEALEMLWEQCFGASFDAWLELAIAARRSPALHARFVDVEQRFAESTIDRFQRWFPEAFADRAVARVAMRLTFSLLDGLALGRIAGHSEDDLADVRAAFNFLSASFLDPQGATP